MKIGLGGTTFGISRTLEKTLIELKVHTLAQQEIESQFERSGLLLAAPFEWLFVQKLTNEVAPDGQLYETCYLRRPDWKLNIRHREYVAPFNLNVSSWEWKNVKSRNPSGQQLSYLPVDVMRRQIEGCTFAVIAQVALEFGHTKEQILPLVEGYDVNFNALLSAHEAWLNLPKKATPNKSKLHAISRDEWVSLEVSFQSNNLSAEESFAKRSELSELLGTVLQNAKLGEGNGTSSGDGTYDVGFLVADFGKAKKLVVKTLKAAGHDINDFEIFSLDADE